MNNLRNNIAISDTGFIFDPATGESFTMNNTGIEVTKMLRNNLSVDEIIRQLAERYDAETIVIEKAIHDFVAMLKDFGLSEDE